MREAKMENWSIVYTPEIILNIDTPRNVYAPVHRAISARLVVKTKS